MSGTILVLITAVLWSTGGVSIKFVQASPALIAVMRSLVAGLVLLPLIRPRSIRLSWAAVGLILSYALTMGTFVTATKWTTAANAIALQYSAPLWLFAAGLVLRTVKPSVRRSAPMLLVLAGITLFLQEPARGTSFKGNIMALVSAVGFALTTVFLRLLRREHGLTLVSLCNLASALLIAPLVRDWGQLGALGASGWTCLVYLGACQIALAYILYAKALTRVRPLKAATIVLIEPVLNPLWVFILIGEKPSVYAIAGAVVMLTGVALDIRLNPEIGPQQAHRAPPAESLSGSKGESSNE